jgi:small-conductance mechanosensitive channel
MMILRLLLLIDLLATLPGSPVAAQVSADDARRTLEVLQDPEKREQLITTLQTIAKARPPTAPASAAPAAAPAAAAPEPAAPPAAPAGNGPIAPGSVGAQVLTSASAFLSRMSNEVASAIGTVRSAPQLLVWLEIMATDPGPRSVLLDAAWRLVLVMLLGLATEWAVRRAIQRPIRALVRQAPNGNALPAEDAEERAERGETEPPHRRRIAALDLLCRVPLVLGRFVLELLPMLALLVVAHLATAAGLGGENPARLVILAVVDAYALCVAILSVARVMFSPRQPRLRLLTLRDQTAAYAMRWTQRIVVIAVFGYALAEVGLLLGLSLLAHDEFLKAVGLVVHVCLGIVVVQERRPVRRLLRAPEGATGPIAAARNWLARIWHWLALLLLGGLWLAWAAEVPHGYTWILSLGGSLVIVAIIARLVQIAVIGALDRTMQPRPETESRNPAVEARLALYHPVLVHIVRALVLLVAIIAVLQLWGLGTLDWLVATTLGRRVLSSLFSFALTLLIAVAIWEAVNASFERHLAKLTEQAQAARSARLRTLLPLLRTTLLITIVIVAGMMVLSEIGVNIGPLLAGAGIVGVAIGFGSQTLVRDLITGIFLLLENAMQVGDTVTVSGLTGTVEALSVRIIRLRAGDGSVHLIPFSSVTTVTNVNRGLGNAAVSVTVAAHEDTDRVCGVLKEIVAGMREEQDYAARMLTDLQLWGVDKLDGASATITGQVVCTDSGRWNVQREFNRRIKRRFEELGIQLYNPMERMVAMRQVTEPREWTDSPPR